MVPFDPGGRAIQFAEQTPGSREQHLWHAFAALWRHTPGTRSLPLSHDTFAALFCSFPPQLAPPKREHCARDSPAGTSPVNRARGHCVGDQGMTLCHQMESTCGEEKQLFVLALCDEFTGTALRPATESDLACIESPSTTPSSSGRSNGAQHRTMSLQEILASRAAHGGPSCSHCGVRGGSWSIQMGDHSGHGFDIDPPGCEGFLIQVLLVSLNAESPQWRRGPPHKPLLCNACGTRYRCAACRWWEEGIVPNIRGQDCGAFCMHLARMMVCMTRFFYYEHASSPSTAGVPISFPR